MQTATPEADVSDSVTLVSISLEIKVVRTWKCRMLTDPLNVAPSFLAMSL